MDFLVGDLLESDVQVIVHQVNCMGVMGSGIASSIRKKYPEVYEEYKKSLELLDCFSGCLLVPTHDGKKVANIFSQYFYKDCATLDEMLSVESWKQPIFSTNRFTNYEALSRGLYTLKDKLQGNETIGFPWGLGSVRGGGSWEVVQGIINEVFQDTNHKIEIWKL